jgi:hypothetical protein
MANKFETFVEPEKFWEFLEDHKKNNDDPRSAFIIHSVTAEWHYVCSNPITKNFRSFINNSKGTLHVTRACEVPEYKCLVKYSEIENWETPKGLSRDDICVNVALETRNSTYADKYTAIKSLARRPTPVSNTMLENLVATYDIQWSSYVSTHVEDIQFDYYAVDTTYLIKYKNRYFLGAGMIHLIDNMTIAFRNGKLVTSPYMYYVSAALGKVCINTGRPKYENVSFQVRKIDYLRVREFSNWVMMTDVNVVGSDAYNTLMEISDKCDPDLFAQLLSVSINASDATDIKVDNADNANNAINMAYIDKKLIEFRERLLTAASPAYRAKYSKFRDVLNQPAIAQSAIAQPAAQPAIAQPAIKVVQKPVQPAVIQPAVKVVQKPVQPAVIQPAVIQPAVIQSIVDQPENPMDEFIDSILCEIPSNGIINQAQLCKFLNLLTRRLGNAAALRIVSRKGSHVQVDNGTAKSTLVVPHGGKTLYKDQIREFIANLM